MYVVKCPFPFYKKIACIVVLKNEKYHIWIWICNEKVLMEQCSIPIIVTMLMELMSVLFNSTIERILYASIFIFSGSKVERKDFWKNKRKQNMKKIQKKEKENKPEWMNLYYVWETSVRKCKASSPTPNTQIQMLRAIQTVLFSFKKKQTKKNLFHFILILFCETWKSFASNSLY